MNLTRHVLCLFVFPLLFLSSTFSVAGQSDSGQQLEQSYEVALHLVIGSNDTGPKTELPASLSVVSRHLKGNFSFSNYRLANTFLGRVTNTGTVEYKSVSNVLGQESESDAQTFLEWSLNSFRSMPNGFQARGFRFGARVPVRVGTSREGAGSPVINYEAVGLTMNLISLPVNTPTLLGTITLPKTTGTIFLVATIKPAEM